MKLTNERKQSLFRTACELLRKGDKLRALDLFERLIALGYRLADTYYFQGRTRFEMGDLAGSIFDFERVLEFDPENSGAFNNIAISQVGLGYYQEAAESYQKAISLCDDNPTVYTNKGLNWINLGQFPKALDEFSAAIDIDPNYPKAYYFRGNVHVKILNFSEALDDFNKAIELEPDFANVHLKRGNIFLYFGDIEYGNAALAYGSEFLSYAFWHKEEDKGLFKDYPFFYEKALDDFNKVIELDPTSSDAHVLRAAVRLKMALYFGKSSASQDLFLKAKRDALKAIDLSGGDKGLYVLSCAEARLGEVPLAMRHLAQSLENGEKSYDQIYYDKNWEDLLDDIELSKVIEIYSESEHLDEYESHIDFDDFDDLDDDIPF